MIQDTMTFEANCKRKAHRLTIPIEVILDNHKYHVNDWSVNGFKVVNVEKELPVGAEIEASFVLPTGNASIVLTFQAILRNVIQNKFGFEITNINEKNARVLRHYASLAIDGTYDHIDALSSDLFMKSVATPIKEPIVLTEKESQTVHRSFLRRFFLYILLFGTVIFFILTLLTYHFLITATSPGNIKGNGLYYTAHQDGLIQSIYVYEQQKIQPHQALYSFDTSDTQELLSFREQYTKLLYNKLQQAQQHLQQLKNTQNQHANTLKKINKKQLQQYQKIASQVEQNYLRAHNLYKQHLITSKQFIEIQSEYFDNQNKLDALRKNTLSSQEKTIIQNNLIKSKDQILALQKIINTIQVQISDNASEIVLLKQQLKKGTVYADSDGIVEHIFINTPQYVELAQDILQIQTRQEPYLVAKLPTQEIENIYITQPCLLYSKRYHQFFSAHVVSIGNITKNNEIPVHIKFDHQTKTLNYNEYLTVYFLNDSSLSHVIRDLLPNKFYMQKP